MKEVICVLCDKLISLEAIANCQTVRIRKNLVHLACSQNATIAEIEHRIGAVGAIEHALFDNYK